MIPKHVFNTCITCVRYHKFYREVSGRKGLLSLLSFIPNRHVARRAAYSGEGPGSTPGGMTILAVGP
jgi:hypothetical protein